MTFYGDRQGSPQIWAELLPHICPSMSSFLPSSLSSFRSSARCTRLSDSVCKPAQAAQFNFKLHTGYEVGNRGRRVRPPNSALNCTLPDRSRRICRPNQKGSQQQREEGKRARWARAGHRLSVPLSIYNPSQHHSLRTILSCRHSSLSPFEII